MFRFDNILTKCSLQLSFVLTVLVLAVHPVVHERARARDERTQWNEEERERETEQKCRSNLNINRQTLKFITFVSVHLAKQQPNTHGTIQIERRMNTGITAGRRRRRRTLKEKETRKNKQNIDAREKE